MNRLLIPVALCLSSAPAIAQAQVDAQLLFPTDWIVPSEYAASVCAERAMVSANRFAELSPQHQQMLLRLTHPSARERELPHACWLPPVPNATMALWNAVMQPNNFNPVTRWSQTALSGGGLNFGDPTTITYSFVPDGLSVPSAVGQPTAPSNLFASFNGAFPSQQIWQQRIGDALERWGQLVGITFVLEPTDDGAPFANALGVAGVRGDVRIAGVNIDGGSNVLAYNYFPDNGDMVLDTADTGFYANANNNYIRLFNVIAHEHGHGMGIAHVCPTDNSKLMEPFINVNFSGPQYDDILTGQRLYGDASEPNDSAAQATNLGTLVDGTDTTTLVSIDGGGDQDYFQFTVASAKQVDVTVRPSGMPYLEGDQNANGSCQAGVLFDPTVLRDLNVEVLAADGTTVLSTGNSAPAGAPETAPSALLPTAGDYYVRVSGGPIDQVQLYELEIVISGGPPFTLQILGGVPASAPEGAPAPVTVRVSPAAGNVDPQTGQLFASVDGGPFVSSPLTSIGGNDYAGLVPLGSCFAATEWYVSFAPQGGGTAISEPFGAPASTLRTRTINEPLATVFSDNFQSNLGWTVTNDAALTDGAWDRGTPVGGGDRGDPATDGDGSGACFLTDNVDGNSDVDGGATQLTSPTLDLSAFPEARIRWLYWYTNNAGGNPGTDTWRTEISDDGGVNWVTVQSTTNSTADWTEFSILVGDFVTLSSQVLVRFTASDPPPGSIVEAGLDGFVVEACGPSPIELLPGSCAGAFTNPTIAVSQTPAENSSFSIDCTVEPTTSGPVFQGFVLGFAQPALPLASCGCTLHPSLEIIDLQLGNWTASNTESWSLPLTLPIGTAGQQFFVQGVALLQSGTCSEVGFPLNTTDALRVTVQ
ncbi:MAG: matrixin family metalloprotease [Planctomycetota bacterium]